MDHPILLSTTTPRFPPKGHTRAPSRSPTRPRITEDILEDLSPASTLEAFTSASGNLRSSIEAATATQRAFGIRAAVAAKKIQEWVAELSAWPWPNNSSEGFQSPIAKRRKLSYGTSDDYTNRGRSDPFQTTTILMDEEFWGSLPARQVEEYEIRIEEISEDMEDLDVEEIKRQVLDTHILPISRPSSSLERHPRPPTFPSYTKMDDFTAVVTATVLQALPSLSKLTKLMDVWSMRLLVLHQIPPLMTAMDDADTALASGWAAIGVDRPGSSSHTISKTTASLSQSDYEIMRGVLQEKVTILGHQIDQLLDTLEGREDTLPEEWLDRMEAIEQDYGDWVVCGERKVREAAWAREIAQRQEQESTKDVVAKAESSPAAVPNDEEDSSVVDHTAGAGQDSIISRSPPSPDSDTNQHGADIQDLSISGSVSDLMPNVSGPLPPISTYSPFDGSKEGALPARAMNDQVHHTRNESLVDLISQNDGANDYYPPLQRGATTFPSALSNNRNGEHSADELPKKVHSPRTPRSEISANNEPTSSRPELPHRSSAPSPSRSDPVDSPSSVILTPRKVPRFGHPLANALRREFSSPEASAVSPPRQSRSVERQDSRARKIRTRSPRDGDKGVSYGSQTPQTRVFPTDNGKRRPQSSSTATSLLTSDASRQIAIAKFSSSPNGVVSSSADRSPIASPSSNIQPIDANDPGEMKMEKPFTLPEIVPHSPESNNNQEKKKSEEIKPSLSQDFPALSSGVQPAASSTKSSDPSYRRTDLHLPLPPPAGEAALASSHLSPDVQTSAASKGHIRGPSSSSAFSGYATSEASPQILEAEPAEYFRPVSPPIRGHIEVPDASDVLTPTRATFGAVDTTSKKRYSFVKETTLSSGNNISGSPAPSLNNELYHTKSGASSLEEADHATVRRESTASKSTSQGRKTSDASAGTVERYTDEPRKHSVSSDTRPVTKERRGSNTQTQTPIKLSSPDSTIKNQTPMTDEESFISVKEYEESPSLGRVRLREDMDQKGAAINSPLPDLQVQRRRPSELSSTESMDDSYLDDSSFLTRPTTPGEPPVFTDVNVSPTQDLSYTSRISDDQLQQQIREILTSIPDRIRLRSEPDTDRSGGQPRIKKRTSRTSLNPFSRTQSRAPTPSFTLAPAYAKNPRPRPQNGNPETRLYHLSRGTGEAPIKLFVRLVGEHGERVMVRVGGGWADLGEYLKEYASHHGRRSDKEGKVEIQDLPSRVVSTGSVASGSTVRNGTGMTSGRSSPISRPGSSLDHRPLSSLFVRKNRKSVGEEARERDRGYRSPSTPLPSVFRSSTRQSETPPDFSRSASSRMEWTEDDSNLGLAGPKSKKVEISKESAAWVESMKEKVRMASAEKEKKQAEFGEIDRVRGTKRLFKKSIG
jgi:hypothetical protein